VGEDGENLMFHTRQKYDVSSTLLKKEKNIYEKKNKKINNKKMEEREGAS
jgi:hypothetical protein